VVAQDLPVQMDNQRVGSKMVEPVQHQISPGQVYTMPVAVPGVEEEVEIIVQQPVAPVVEVTAEDMP
jgi:hypothetical protein